MFFLRKGNCIDSLFQRYIWGNFWTILKKKIFLKKLENGGLTGACRWWIGPTVYNIVPVIHNWNRNNFYFVYSYAFSLYMNLNYSVKIENKFIFHVLNQKLHFNSRLYYYFFVLILKNN